MDSPSKKRKTANVQLPPDLSDDQLIEEIITASPVYKKAIEMEAVVRPRFIGKGGLPTKQYQSFLQRVVERLADMNQHDRDAISQALMTWEEDALTGIMRITPEDPFYPTYSKLLQAVLGDKHSFIHPDGMIDLANSTIVLTLSEIRKGCTYGNSCRRHNPLHRSLMHAKPQVNGGKRKTFKRTTRKSKKLKRRTYRK
jgi:hypothetical protein